MEEVPLTPAPGGGAQEFRLQWKNFSTNLATSLDIFKNEKDFVDVTLVCEGQQLLAHRMLLCACSPYFRNIIKANPCPHPIIILSNEVKYTDLEKLLDFMYQGSVNVVQEHLARFLKTAEMLKIRGLADDDKKSMQPVQHPSSPCVSNSGTITPNDCGSSPKRPRLSLENNASNPCTSTSSTLNNSSSTNNSYSNNTTPPTTLASSVNLDTPNTPSNIEESTHSANDSDSEMLPVKQEMVELKSCDEFETDADHFIPEAYLKDGVGLSEGAVQGIGQGPPPPPGALRPSYVPPPPIKAQEDSAPNNTGADELSQGSPPFLFNFPLNSTPMRPPLNISGNTFSTPTSTRVKKKRSPKSFPPSYASIVPNSTSPLPPPPLYTNSAFRTPSRKTPPGFAPFSSDRAVNGLNSGDSPVNCITSPISPKIEGTSPDSLRGHRGSPEESGIPHGYTAASLLASAYAAAAAGNGRHSPHILAQTNKDNARLTCEQCQKSFTSRSNLNKHKRVQHSGEEFICTYCGSKFKNRYYIKEHTALCVASCQKKAAAAAAAAAVMAVSAGNTPMRPKSAGNENMKCSPPNLVNFSTSPTTMNYTLTSVTPSQPVVQMAGQPAPTIPLPTMVATGQPAPTIPLPTMVATGQPALPTMIPGKDADADEQPTDLAIHSRNNSVTHSISDAIALTNENAEIL